MCVRAWARSVSPVLCRVAHRGPEHDRAVGRLGDRHCRRSENFPRSVTSAVLQALCVSERRWCPLCVDQFPPLLFCRASRLVASLLQLFQRNHLCAVLVFFPTSHALRVAIWGSVSPRRRLVSRRLNNRNRPCDPEKRTHLLAGSLPSPCVLARAFAPIDRRYTLYLST